MGRELGPRESYSIQIILRKTKATSYPQEGVKGELLKQSIAQTKDYDKARMIFEAACELSRNAVS